MGLPSCVVVVADNQTRIAEALGRQRVAIHLEHWSELSPLELARLAEAALVDREKRSELSGSGRKLVDGTGSTRVVDELSRSRMEQVHIQ